MKTKKEENKMQTNPVVKETNNLAVIPQGDWGNANDFDSEDLLIPKLHLMQGQSKKVAEGAAHIGDIVNLLTGEKVGDGKTSFGIYALTSNKTWIVTMKEGNKFVSQFPYNASNKDLPWEDKDENGNDIKRSKVVNLYCMLGSSTPSSTDIPFVISLKGKSFKTAKLISNHFNSMQQMRLPPFAKCLMLKSKVDKNDKGTFQVWDMTVGANASKETMDICNQWYNRIKQSPETIKVDHSDVETEETDLSDNHIPF